ncbi:MAG: site-2 protease family protein [Nanoarchaeota archaeon]|nr:site-2 protease family protein [Nanoarchaeota archaeon]
MDVQSVAALVFIALLSLGIYIERKKIVLQKILFPLLYVVLYRTKLGIDLMDKTARKFSKLWHFLVPISIVVGFLGMILISYALIDNIIQIFTQPDAVPGVGLVLPINVKGAFYVPFFFWITSIFIIALVHEFSHGLFARLYKMKVKSSGFAFFGILLPIIPAAFVEPDENDIVKRPAKQQLAMYSAGPFANIVLAFIVLGISALLIGPIANNVIVADGVEISGYVEGDYPAEAAGVGAGELITTINDEKATTIAEFSALLDGRSAGDTITLTTNTDSYTLILGEHPTEEGVGYLGVQIQQHTTIDPAFADKYGSFTADALLWFLQLLYWLYLLNLGIGLFNLAPMGPLDGGRMLLVGLEQFLSKKTARKYWKNIGFFFFTLVVFNIMFSFVR